jgi:hypothetical protein
MLQRYLARKLSYFLSIRWKSMQRSKETAPKSTNLRAKSRQWLRRRTKRCTQLCYKTKSWESIIPTYYTRCIVAMKTVTETLSIPRCRGKHITENQIRTLIHLEEALIIVLLLMCMTRHHSTLSSQYWSLTTTHPSQISMDLMRKGVIPISPKDYSRMHQITAVPFIMIPLHSAHNRQWVHL